MGKLRELKLAGVDQWEELGLHLCVRKRKLGQSWPFRTGSTVIPKIVQDALKARDALNEHLFTRAVVEYIEEDMVIERVQEELEMEAGRPLKEELLLTPPAKRSKPNVSTIFNEAVESIKESERESQQRQLLLSKDTVQFFFNP